MEFPLEVGFRSAPVGTPGLAGLMPPFQSLAPVCRGAFSGPIHNYAPASIPVIHCTASAPAGMRSGAFASVAACQIASAPRQRRPEGAVPPGDPGRSGAAAAKRTPNDLRDM